MIHVQPLFKAKNTFINRMKNKTQKYHTVGTIKKKLEKTKKYHTVGTIKPVDSCLVTDRETFYHKKKKPTTPRVGIIGFYRT
jgi:hypothetical protein